MSDIAVRVVGLSKQYRIRGSQKEYHTLREILTDAVVSPFRRATKLLRGQASGASELDEVFWALASQRMVASFFLISTVMIPLVDVDRDAPASLPETPNSRLCMAFSR